MDAGPGDRVNADEPIAQIETDKVPYWNKQIFVKDSDGYKRIWSSFSEYLMLYVVHIPWLGDDWCFKSGVRCHSEGTVSLRKLFLLFSYHSRMIEVITCIKFGLWYI